ncbi:hypothetical protein ASPTUDRAFT_33528 [Aspergillus tubingensis CBS 134.48]|uniref:Uncharacterized protein n=1 Tax=Aspergillus tubingensis (strain CBS 134.48) TaxID=767770 RepID=A0A1L9MUJ5_ASPTC|nr:hypothetical protein ASPTUDRAFT_33528 [Aspergillus tubingensis CBS 134.48]
MADSCQRNLLSHMGIRRSASGSSIGTLHQSSRLRYLRRRKFQKKKHELHPENVVHSARLEFSLHIDGKQPRCVQDFAFKKHSTVKATEGQSGVECEHPCYIDVEFTTIGGVSYGIYHENVSRLNEPAKRVFEHLQLLTSRNNREPRTVKFRVDLDPAKMDHIASFVDALGGLSGYLPNSKAFHPYRGHSGEPRIIFSQ